jgi:phosphomannomutase
MLRDRPPTPEEVAALQRGRGEGDGEDRHATEPRTLDISFDYVAGLQETFVESLTAQLHVVIDPMHGCWAGKARRYLQAVFPHCLFSTVHDVVDNRLDDRAADGFRTAELHELGEAVYRERAHLGLAFDADGDRLMLVDNEGVVLSPEEAVCSLLACLGDELRGEPFVYDLRYSDRIAKAARQIGAKPLMERGDETFIRARMGETGAAFGAELSGHYFYGAMQGRDDPLYTVCRLIAYLARSGQTLAALRRGCGPVYMTPELRVAVAVEEQPAIIEQVRAAWAEFPQLALDGVRIDIPGGWALVRSAVAEPALTFRFEGLDWHALENLVRRFCDTLPEYGERLWGCYRAAMGGEES